MRVAQRLETAGNGTVRALTEEPVAIDQPEGLLEEIRNAVAAFARDAELERVVKRWEALEKPTDVQLDMPHHQMATSDCKARISIRQSMGPTSSMPIRPYGASGTTYSRK